MEKKKLNLNKLEIGKLSTNALENIQGGGIKLSDSANTFHTQIEGCCRGDVCTIESIDELMDEMLKLQTKA